ncbi:MAG: cysteine desulfurase family protein [Nitrososphaerales archaeon]
MKRIYVDYAATTPLDARVLEAMKPYLTSKYGNAESVNTFGMEARSAVEESRRKLAEFMNAELSEVIFTGSATEANNMVLKCHAFQEGKDKAHIAVTKIEHSCVLNSAAWLEKEGYKVTYLPVDHDGLLDMKRLEEVLKGGVSLVSVIHGNNEIGTIQPIREIGRLCHDYDTYFHTDAAQTFGKIPIDVKAMNIDMMTVNAHKIYGPKGVGALYLNKDVKLEPLLHGGEHEFGLRAGTHNVPGIVGLAKTVELRAKEMKEESERLTEIRDKLIKGALEIDETYLNGHPTKRLYNNVNLRFLYIESESLVLQLDMEGVSASSASACSSRTEESSYVLLALGLDPLETRGSLRMSLGKYNTPEDVDFILEVLPKVVKQLRRISPLAPSRIRLEQ